MVSMLLNVSQIRGAHERFVHTYDSSAFPEADDAYRLEGPVRLAFEIFKDRDRYRLVGRVTARLQLVCGRCLEGFPRPVEAEFDLRYVPQADNTGEGDRRVEEDDLTTAYYREETIDLGQLVREQIYLALPMKPLCVDACRGLCRECGANLNLGACGCARVWQDPRLAGLRALLDRQADK